MKEPTMRTEELLVTPAWAMEKLQKLEEAQAKGGFRQRTPRERSIQKYTMDMRAGKWRLTHQGIAFDTAGHLIDGQNRLWAVVRSGVSVPMTVTYDCPPEVISDIDQGSVRGIGTILSMSHGWTLFDASEAATAARQIINLVVTAQGKAPTPARKQKLVMVSPSEALMVLDELGFNQSLDRLKVIIPVRRARKASIIAPLAWYHAAKPKLAEKMAREYATLEELPKGSPTLALFRYYEAAAKQRIPQIDLWGVTANAIYYFDSAVQLPFLNTSREALRWLVKLNQPVADKILSRVQ